MRHYPDADNKYDQEDLARLNAQPWMVRVLKFNPDYTGWGPHEDYMADDKEGWNSRQLPNTWSEFGPWELDDLNELANFYFSVERDSKECPSCGGSGYHPDALWVSGSFYESSSPFTRPTRSERESKKVLEGFGSKFTEPLGRGTYPPEELLLKYGSEFRLFCEDMRVVGFWRDKITRDEADALIAAKRADTGSSAQQINNAQHDKGFGHDCINQHILIEARLARFGMPKTCPECEGHGYVYTEPAAHVSLVLWMLHPRKGCSRGIQIKTIERAEVQQVLAYLTLAAERNQARFQKAVNMLRPAQGEI